ncbi:hypothetical protein TcasGA2_TC004218 [Tribolium castaneum]|uniref:Uncharacterized protein n=1 Tax=Tribolium castaneum TaxID=7070 RepID=D7ELR7_TRICA|nr:hypothetical protein TcasGA2_TC004218 [Tribolium castaneum]
MALLGHLRGLCVVGTHLRVSLVRLHVLSRPPRYSPPTGGRSLYLWTKPSQRDLKIADDIPDTYDLIYRNTMGRYVLGAQIITLLAGGAVLLGYALLSEYEHFEGEVTKWSPTSRATDDQEVIYAAFFVLFAISIQTMIRRVPIRIYKVPQTPKYISINYGPFGKQRFSFKRGEVFHGKETGFLPWKENRYVVQTKKVKRNLIMLETYFRKPADMNIMLGEQKDPDLEETSSRNI